MLIPTFLGTVSEITHSSPTEHITKACYFHILLCVRMDYLHFNNDSLIRSCHMVSLQHDNSMDGSVGPGLLALFPGSKSHEYLVFFLCVLLD